MTPRPIKRHGPSGGYWPSLSDAELDKAFGLNEPDTLKHDDLAWVRSPNQGHLKLAQYIDRDGDGKSAYWAYFGTDWTDRPEDVEMVRRVAVIWA
ncbi:hypothetical protein ACIA8K_12490 [Catenuloplanes sp. NPDC051500]|uniref:hypothetical protein n=1 Tax=Catenuloplanes sp. NPDC051500 TaxID=3363959 RepID=UPI00379BA433